MSLLPLDDRLLLRNFSNTTGATAGLSSSIRSGEYSSKYKNYFSVAAFGYRLGYQRCNSAGSIFVLFAPQPRVRIGADLCCCRAVLKTYYWTVIGYFCRLPILPL
jgi:hypothetical protein